MRAMLGRGLPQVNAQNLRAGLAGFLHSREARY